MLDEITVFYQLCRLQADYWTEVDHNYGRNARGYFTPDGLFAVGSERMSGREEIAAFYTWREQRSERTARHVFTNPRVTGLTADGATFECIMSLYADDGAPVLNSQPPVLIADVRDRCVRHGETWLFQSHVLTPVFVGGVKPTIPSRSELLAHTAEAAQ